MDEAEFCNVIGMMYRSRLIALNDPDALKDEMRGILFEVDCHEPGRAEKILRDLPTVQDVVAQGVILHVLMTDENEKGFLEKVLMDNEIVIDRIERVLPSLEDVFVSLVDQENRLHVRAEID
jgi:ABC-2 type transport system ATP-binding protein